MFGEATGRDIGWEQAMREALFTVLMARSLLLSPEQEKRIRECTDIERMNTWIERAATATSSNQVLRVRARSPRKAPAKPARPASRRRANRS